MFDFLASFFGSDTKETDSTLTEEMARASEELDIEMAASAHHNWKLRLELYIAGTSQETFIPSIVCSDNHCDLGRWIYGKGTTHLGKYPGFSALRTHHKMFHLAASNVISLMQADQKLEAKKVLTTQFTEISAKVLGDLQLMHKVVENHKVH